MTLAPATARRPFDPGTTGWSVDDLYDPAIQRQWSHGRFEIVEGVLTKMPPQGYRTISPLSRLRRMLERQLDATKQGGFFHNEVDLGSSAHLWRIGHNGRLTLSGRTLGQNGSGRE